MTGRSANKGECTHPCRWNYALMEESRPGEYFPVEEYGNGTLLFNSRDLCLLDHLPALVETGMDSLKIEGRMKGVHYLGTTVRVYRLALDRLAQEGPEAFRPESSWQEELSLVSRRGYTTGFLFGPPSEEGQIYTPPIERGTDFVGIVRKTNADGSALIEVRGPVNAGDELEFLGKASEIRRYKPTQLQTSDGSIVEKANPNSLLSLTPPFLLNPCDLVRRRNISIST
jgi:putative protease